MNLARELKKLWNIKVKVIFFKLVHSVQSPSINGPEDLEIIGQVEIIQTTASIYIYIYIYILDNLFQEPG